MNIDRNAAQTYARWFQALADPSRIVILNLLADARQPMTVGEIVAAVDIGQSTVSHHLKLLAQVGFVHVAQQISMRAARSRGMRMGVRTWPADVGCPWLRETVQQIDAGVPSLGCPRLRREREYQCLRSLRDSAGGVRDHIPFPQRAGQVCRCCTSGAPLLMSART